MAWWWCCCGAGCWHFSDDFHRADSDDPGSSWIERHTDADISTNRLKLSPGAVVECTSHPPSRRMIGTTWTVPAGGKARVAVVYEYDATKGERYYFGEIDNTGSETIIRVGYKFYDDTVQILDTYSAGWLITEVPFCVEYITANIGAIHYETYSEGACGDPREVSDSPPFPARPAFALINAGTATIYCTGVDAWEHYWENQNPDCPACMCTCNGYWIPPKLRATWSTTGECALHGLDGAYIDLEVDLQCVFTWSGGPKLLCPAHDGLPAVYWDLTLQCQDAAQEPNDPTRTWLLKTSANECASVIDGWTECDPGESCAVKAEPSLMICDPIHIEFGPFTMQGSGGPPDRCGCCNEGYGHNPSGTYTITITEPP